MQPIILASSSPRRRELFSKLNIPFQVFGSRYREKFQRNMPPRKLAEFLAQKKAEKVLEAFPKSVIIGADTLISYGTKILGKPKNKAHAQKMLNLLSGKAHEVITAVSIIDKTGKAITKSFVSKVVFKKLSKQDIEDYIKTKEPFDKAGAYAIQGEAKKFIKSFEGDLNTIIGLPISFIKSTLKELNII